VDWVLAIWGIAAALLWSAFYVGAAKILLRMQQLESLTPPQPADGGWPKLSVVIAACNEAEHIEDALDTILASGYPNLEVVVVNDRSDDATGDILDAVSKRDDRVVPLHVDTLREGWLGKVHALNRGTEAATGEWLLFTDADIHFSDIALTRSVALCLHDGLDHLTVIPNLETRGTLMNAAVVYFGMTLLLVVKADQIGDDGSDAFLGVGAFNLVRRSTFDKSEGWHWLKMEVADDVGLGYMMHRAGARGRALLGQGHVKVAWYDSVGGLIRGLEKNFYGAMAQYNPRKLVALFVGIGAILGGIPALFLQGLSHWVWIGFGSLLLGSQLAAAWVVHKKLERPLFSQIFVPLGVLLTSWALLRSAIVCHRQNGIVWRGTRYSLDDLRTGRRVDL